MQSVVYKMNYFLRFFNILLRNQQKYCTFAPYFGLFIYIFLFVLRDILNTLLQRECLQIRIFLSVCVLLCLLPSASAQHFIRFNVDFSYARDFASAGASAPNVEDLSLAEAQDWIGSGRAEKLTGSNGFSPALGLGYRYQYKHLLVDVGIGAEYRHRFNGLSGMEDITAVATDDYGTEYTGHHSWTSRTAVMQHAAIHLPVMIGGEWEKVYFLAGAKMNLDVWGRSQEKGRYTLVADYDRFMDPFENMKEHGIVDKEPYTCSPKSMAIGWDLRVCAEVGYHLSETGHTTGSRSIKPQYYIGAFAEYGVVTKKDYFHPFLAGVRLTILLPLKTTEACKCWNN